MCYWGFTNKFHIYMVLIASVCGHTMHFDCWDMFYAAK